MSDGPHRSLPLNKGWRKFAEHADNKAYSAEEVSNALPSALEKDWRSEISQSLFNEIRNVLGDSSQGSLLSDSKLEQLDMMRSSGVGNNFSNTLIDCAEDAVRQGLFGNSAVQYAVTAALQERAYEGIRSVEEHYQRRNVSGQRILNIRDRLEAGVVGCSISNIAAELSSKGRLSNNYRINKNTSLDVGPPL